ncbi:Crp/Fnr family transcriptional regulator [Rubrivirga sp.]|uniref:Crp/Fnr family transcriptional regulator n=1 Tax=Rubrivirga sp. TaxID=1885344 RepID=UPI003C761CD2
MIPANLFVRSFASSAPLREHVFGLLARRLSRVIELVDAVAFQRVDARLAARLLEAEHDGHIDTTHERLADELATSREVVSRALEEFERRGWVALSRGRVTVLEGEALRADASV